jgi:hypothetical protein
MQRTNMDSVHTDTEDIQVGAPNATTRRCIADYFTAFFRDVAVNARMIA